MITELSREQLVKVGANLRADYLVQQTGYTLALASAEEPAIEGLIGDPKFLEEVASAKTQVESGMQDKELMAQESKQLHSAQQQKMREAKIWRRKVVMRASRTRRRGGKVPAELATIGRATTVPEITGQLTLMLGAFQQHLGPMGGDSAKALLDEGKGLLSDLSRADAEQETARLAGLPQKVRDFYETKGILYTGLKIINDAGRELHAADLARAATYNLRILHRRAKRPGPEEPEE